MPISYDIYPIKLIGCLKISWLAFLPPLLHRLMRAGRQSRPRLSGGLARVHDSLGNPEDL
jgi:hypothetical protein